MAVYVDAAIWKWRGLRWCHLLADNTNELHRFAVTLGIARTSYQGPPKTATPHYDLTAYERRLALRLGAISCSREEIITVRHRVSSPVMKSEFTQFACGATMITSIAVSPCISAMMAMARSTSD